MSKQEPVPGKFYRTRSGQNLKYITETSRYYLYEEHDTQNLFKYNLPFFYCIEGDSNWTEWDIVGEWPDEVVLPAVEIKRWAVVYNKGPRRGEMWSTWNTENQARIDRHGIGMYHYNKSADDFEIIELTGVLPERKVNK